jgi:hypothetical protein
MRKLRSKVGNTYFSDILEEIDNSAKKGSAQSYSGGRGRRGASIKKAQLKAKVA